MRPIQSSQCRLRRSSSRLVQLRLSFGEERLIGDAAKNQAARNPANTVYDAKRLIGRKFTDGEVQQDLKLWPFKVVPGSGNDCMIEVKHKNAVKRLRPEEISSKARKETPRRL